MQARNDWQQLFQLVLIVKKKSSGCAASIALCGLLWLFGRAAKADLEKPGRIHSEKTMAAEWTSTSLSSWVWSLTSFRCCWDPFDARLLQWMGAAGDCWSSPRHVPELRERVIWSQRVWISAGHSLLHGVAYYKLTSGTTHVLAVWCVIGCFWCKKYLQLRDQLLRFFS